MDREFSSKTYTVTVTYEGVSHTIKCFLSGDPSTWKRVGEGPDGVARFIPNGSEADENRYQLGKQAWVAMRMCMAEVHKAFF